MATATATLKDVRGVVGELDLTFAPGANVLRGGNEEGKTSAVDAVRRALADSGIRLTPNITAERGSASIGGVILSITPGQVRTSGRPTVRLLDHGVLGQLIDGGGHKGQAARDKARIEALRVLYPIPVDDALLLRICQGDEDLAAAVQGQIGRAEITLDGAAEAVRQMAHTEARDRESRRDEARGRVQAAVKLLERLELQGSEKGPTVAEATAALEAARRKADRLATLHEERQRREQEKEEIRQTLGAEPDWKSWAVAELADLSEQTAKATEAQWFLDSLREIAEGVKSRDRELERWCDERAILDRPLEDSEGNPLPDLADVELAREASTKAEGDLELARAREDAKTALADKEAAEADAEREDSRAGLLRTLTKGLPAAVQAIMAEQGLPDMDFDGGVLRVADHDGILMPFEDLSFGGRVRRALELYLPANEGFALLPLEPAFWNALQPKRKLEMASLATEREIGLLTEEPTDDPGVTLIHISGEEKTYP